MKKIIIIIFFLIPSLLFSQNVYYIATDGDDDDAGTIDAPWATWQKGFDEAEAGDTVYFRGGRWNLTANEYVLYNPSGGHGNNGTHSNPIHFFNYPGEVPILDCIGHTNATDATGFDIRDATYFKLRGLTIENELDDGGQWIASMMIGTGVAGNGTLWLDQITCRNGGGYGIYVVNYDTLYMTNCDSYGHVDENSATPGNRADGFTISALSSGPTDTLNYTYIYGCRAWNNSDDGFEVSATGELHMINCWSFGNGRLEYGDGNGWKLSWSYVFDRTKRNIINCLAAENRGAGFTETNFNAVGYGPMFNFYNNSIYKCYFGFNAGIQGNYDCGDGTAYENYRNNIVYNSTWGAYLDQGNWKLCYYFGDVPNYAIGSNNTWVFTGTDPYWSYNSALSWSHTGEDAQFVSLDTTGLSGARGADGTLPSTTFMHPAEGSAISTGGVAVGLIYDGRGYTFDDDTISVGYVQYAGKAPEEEGGGDPPEDEEGDPPTCTTGTTASVHSRLAIIRGNITSDGGEAITERGLVYSTTNENPTTSDSKIVVSGTTGSFYRHVNTLSNTTYYVRAYATNSVGTSYGASVSFTTPEVTLPLSGTKVSNVGGVLGILK